MKVREFAGNPQNMVFGGFWQAPGSPPLPRKGCSITPECSGKCSGVFPIVSHGLEARGSVFISETHSEISEKSPKSSKIREIRRKSMKFAQNHGKSPIFLKKRKFSPSITFFLQHIFWSDFLRVLRRF